MDRLQIRGEVRGILQDTLKHIIEEIAEEAENEGVKINRKREWVKDKVKQDINSYLLPTLYARGPTEHFIALHMTKESFNWLLKRVEPYIQKADTVMRRALPASLKLEIVLHLFATGSCLRILELMFNVSRPSISLMIHKVCDAICLALKDYNKEPTHEEWKAVETSYRNTWDFPGCCGGLDGKFVVMKSQSETGNHYHKIALLAICDDDYCFKYFEVLSIPKMSKEVFEESNLTKALENNLLPPNHVILGSDKFPLKKYLMKPFEEEQSEKNKVFNYRLSRARSVIDNSFGLLVSRFRIFEKPLPFSADKIEKIVKTCCALHNWLRITKSPTQVTTLDVENSDTGNIIPGLWRELLIEGLAELPKNKKDYSSKDAHQIRADYADFFMGEQAVSWQHQKIS